VRLKSNVLPIPVSDAIGSLDILFMNILQSEAQYVATCVATVISIVHVNQRYEF